MDYKSQGPYNVHIQVLKKTTVKKGGVTVDTYEPGKKLWCSCIQYSTSETNFTDLKATQNDWTVETYYTTHIQAGDRIKILSTGEVFAIKGKPENVRMMNRHLKFKMGSIDGK